MFINTSRALSVGTILVIIIHNENTLSRVIVKVKRIRGSHNDCSGIGVELYRPSKVYSNLVSNLKNIA